uniref:Variant surface glycoprotein 1245 n=1 Tax=Trypanosoma brucei TaxID=5691 RepID=M4TB52_9TRYP|nr:variant surface glycoprotein 1245 [Trypanosoma brucei]
MQTQKEAGKRWSQTLNKFLLLALALRATEQTTNPAAVKGFCTETWYIDKLKEALQLRSQAAAAAALTAAEEAKQLTLAATRYALTPKGPGYNALSAVATARTAAITAAVPGYLQIVEKALLLLSTKHGELKYMEAVESGNTPVGNSGKVSEAAPNLIPTEHAKTCTVTQSVRIKPLKDCGGASSDRSTAEAEAANVNGWTQILIRGTAAVSTLEIKTIGSSKGTALNAGTNFGGISDKPGCGSNAGDAAHGSHASAIGLSAKSITATYKAGNIQVTPPQPEHAAPEAQSAPNSQQIQLITSDDTLRQALVAAFAAAIPSSKKVTTETLDTLLSDPTINKLLEAMAATQGKKSEKQLTDDDKETLLFGARKGDIQTTYIKNLEQDEITISREPEIKGTTKKLSENNFADAMGYFYGQKMKKKTANKAETKPEVGGEKADSEEKKRRKERWG